MRTRYVCSNPINCKVLWIHSQINALPFHSTLFLDLLQTEQALTCLADIAKHGESAAAKYLESAPNAECKKIAEAFFHG